MLSEDSMQSLAKLRVYGVPQFRKECKELVEKMIDCHDSDTKQVCLMSKLHENSVTGEREATAWDEQGNFSYMQD